MKNFIFVGLNQEQMTDIIGYINGYFAEGMSEEPYESFDNGLYTFGFTLPEGHPHIGKAFHLVKKYDGTVYD